MKEAKIQFSTAEADLMCNAEVILTKNKIMDTMKLLLEELMDQMMKESENKTDDLFKISPKISRGENYRGLPYLVLDYPRLFSRKETFAIRTMFWWGHYFSTTLHISGELKEKFTDKIKNAYSKLADKEIFIGISEDPWLHHIEQDNYKSVQEMSEEEFRHVTANLPHIKIAAKWPLNQWHLAAKILFENWMFLLRICFD